MDPDEIISQAWIYSSTLLDISVISRVIYCISPSIIQQIPFTVNNCNTLCIMGIFCDVRPHIQRLTVFFKIVLFSSFLTFGIGLIRFALQCLQCRNSLGLTTLDVTSLVMIGKSVCPSCQKQRERLEYICTSEIYRGITLLSASTVDSIYNGFYIVFYRVAPRRATCVRGRHESSAADEPARVELRRTSALSVDASYERIRPASKVKIYVCLSVCLCQIFAHQFNP